MNVWKDIGRIIGVTLFFYFLILLIMLLWEGNGLFIYENF